MERHLVIVIGSLGLLIIFGAGCPQERLSVNMGALQQASSTVITADTEIARSGAPATSSAESPKTVSVRAETTAKAVASPLLIKTPPPMPAPAVGKSLLITTASNQQTLERKPIPEVSIEGVWPLEGITIVKDSIKYGFKPVARFKITNRSDSKIYFYSFDFKDRGSHSATDGTRLRYEFRYSNSNEDNISEPEIGGLGQGYYAWSGPTAYTSGKLEFWPIPFEPHSFRYLTVTANRIPLPAAATSYDTLVYAVKGDTFSLSVPSGGALFSVDKESLGVYFDPDSGKTVNDIKNFLMQGTPLQLGTVVQGEVVIDDSYTLGPKLVW